MKFVSKCHIENVGDFEYYITKTFHETDEGGIATYGIAVKDALSGEFKEVEDIWEDENEILNFIGVLCKERVLPNHLQEKCEEFVEELYSI